MVSVAAPNMHSHDYHHIMACTEALRALLEIQQRSYHNSWKADAPASVYMALLAVCVCV